MKAFISYSHKDEEYLKLLHTHLAAKRREGLIDSWDDREITAGGNLDQEIKRQLDSAELFIALISPHYIDSDYCFNKEFEYVQELAESSNLKIIAIICEDCDWKSTDFKNLKALPKDGKAIATWSNSNSAMLTVIQEIERVLDNSGKKPIAPAKQTKIKSGRNYKVQQDFDSIQKHDFVDKGYKKLVGLLKQNLEEVHHLDGIKYMVKTDTEMEFKVLLVNRSKTMTEATLTLNKGDQNNRNSNSMRSFGGYSDFELSYKIRTSEGRTLEKGYSVSQTDYKLIWIQNNSPSAFSSYNINGNKENTTVNTIADSIWTDWLNQVGIDF